VAQEVFESLIAEWERMESRKHKETEALEAAGKLLARIKTYEESEKLWSEAAQSRNLYEMRIAEYGGIEKEYIKASEERHRIAGINLRKEREYAQRKAAFDAKVKGLKDKKREKESLMAKHEAQIANLMTKIRFFEQDSHKITGD